TMNPEDYIKNLTPDLLEKARACSSVEELLALAKEESIPVPDETIAAIAGGTDDESGSCNPTLTCQKCGSDNTYTFDGVSKCMNCGFEWYSG
ncbi:MAG: hypothetical protein J5804_05895, partial [Eggerthellaceae bacterium]|nr:hypothetical protein [Eggerthellaceae bacterium]